MKKAFIVRIMKEVTKRALAVRVAACVSVFFISAFSLKADLIQKADSAYLADDYALATTLYLDAEKESGSSSALLYNIGNSYYRSGEIGKAILYYKRALKLDPTNSDARQNLQFAMTKTVDKQDDNRTFVRKVADNIMFSNTPDGWAIMALVMFAVFLGAAAMYVFSGSVVIRKICFFGGLIVLVLDGCVLYMAQKTASIVSDRSTAVVISPNVQLSTVPRVPKDKSEQAFQLHEGAVVDVVDSVKLSSDTVSPLWLEVKVDNVHRAWINSKDVERL